jgi:prevent-host-death family protein
MGPVNLKEARRRLSDLVRAAEHGESVVITRRGKEVARIAPVEKKPAKRFPDLTKFRKSIKMRGKPMSEVVIASRREARY